MIIEESIIDEIRQANVLDDTEKLKHLIGYLFVRIEEENRIKKHL